MIAAAIALYHEIGLRGDFGISFIFYYIGVGFRMSRRAYREASRNGGFIIAADGHFAAKYAVAGCKPAIAASAKVIGFGHSQQYHAACL